jgi:hypothetical protein
MPATVCRSLRPYHPSEVIVGQTPVGAGRNVQVKCRTDRLSLCWFDHPGFLALFDGAGKSCMLVRCQAITTETPVVPLLVAYEANLAHWLDLGTSDFLRPASFILSIE